MGPKDQELEVKFYLTNLHGLEERLKKLGARLKHNRVYEINLRFDNAQNELVRTTRVLRLRKDEQARVTYKGPGLIKDGVRQRQELEFYVNDFDTAQAVFEALGYQVVVMYEKFRTTYELDDVEVTLDEMPYGSFCELEGPSGQAIQSLSGKLGLNWEARVNDSYLMLFDHLKAAKSLQFRDLSFENFKGISTKPEELGVKPGGL